MAPAAAGADSSDLDCHAVMRAYACFTHQGAAEYSGGGGAGVSSMKMIPLSDDEFVLFQHFIQEAAGISLSYARKPLVGARLRSRLRHYRLLRFADYFRLLQSGSVPEESQIAIDLLTTNETQLFREPAHFDLLRALALRARLAAARFRVWSAACSSGEEAYSIAMVLDDCLGADKWEVLGTDISMKMLMRARKGHYLLERSRNVPAAYLQRYCLRGVAQEEGTLLVRHNLRRQIHFQQINLVRPLPQIGLFDVIFLRNILIYFDQETKHRVFSKVGDHLKPGGCLLTGHSESMSGNVPGWDLVSPAAYRKV